LMGFESNPETFVLKEEQVQLCCRCAFDQSKPHGARVLCCPVVRSYFTMDQDFTMATHYEKTMASLTRPTHKIQRRSSSKGNRFYTNYTMHYLSFRSPSTSEVLRLAIRSQHPRRWEMPRDSYPMTKTGYHSWHTFLKRGKPNRYLRCVAITGILEK